MSRKLLLSLMAAALLCSALPAWSQEVPDGKGKEMVAAQCNSCHEFYARLGSGYTAEGWRTVMQMMINHGVPIPPDQLATMTQYLTKNFPEKGKPAAVVVPGPAKASMKRGEGPTPRAPARQPPGGRGGKRR